MPRVAPAEDVPFSPQTMEDDSEPDMMDTGEPAEGEGPSAAASAPKLTNQADIEAAMKDANEAIAGTGAYADPKTGEPMPRNRKLVLARLKEMGITVKE